MTTTEQAETAPTITAADAGCWLDGAMGWHNTYRVIYVAQRYGFALDADDETMVAEYAVDHVESDADYEAVYALSNEATDYLQSLAPEGYDFVWDDGLGLYQSDLDEGEYLGA
jgi:hypothetical protein